MNITTLMPEHLPALQDAIDRDPFHEPAERWAVTDFTDPQASSEVVEDSRGPVVFVRFTKTIRISCVWADPNNLGRNARAVIAGMNDAIDKSIKSGYKEIIVTTNHPPLEEFLKKFGFAKATEDYVLQLS